MHAEDSRLLSLRLAPDSSVVRILCTCGEWSYGALVDLRSQAIEAALAWHRHDWHAGRSADHRRDGEPRRGTAELDDCADQALDRLRSSGSVPPHTPNRSSAASS